MKLRELVTVGILMVLAITGWMRGWEYADKKVINKDKWAVSDHIVKGDVGSPKATDEWVPKFSDELKVETNDKHDAHGLPPGVSVDTGYKSE